MKIEIKHRYTGSVLFADATESLLTAVEQASKCGADLSDAELGGADLGGTYLRCAHMSGADLREADLRDADLRGSDMRGAELSYADLREADLSYVNLRGAHLSGASLSNACLRGAVLIGADLRDADLRGSDLGGAALGGADFRGSDLTGANLRYADLREVDLRGAALGAAPVVGNIHQRVYAAASQPGALDMGRWHSACGTTHCRAGHVVVLAGEAGRALEATLGTAGAAMAIYLASDPERFRLERIPNFYCDNEEALADMKRLAEAEAAARPAVSTKRPVNALYGALARFLRRQVG